ncbi:hypothetical protein [uncultured Prevotella sp.]|uniref:hypothetical protein n=1 Tax=uncultured Prevotella sp. TaxID=159272 RepID=UPI00259ADEB6|nr:hypothetical protein [uncultured Prevotella sp.]
MRKIFLSALFAAFFGGIASAHPITVTLSRGQQVTLESNDYATTAELLEKVEQLEKEFNG